MVIEMYRKKNTSKFLLASLLLHVTAFLILMRIVISPPESPPSIDLKLIGILKIHIPAKTRQPPKNHPKETPKPTEKTLPPLSPPIPPADFPVFLEFTANEPRAAVLGKPISRATENNTKFNVQSITSARPGIRAGTTTAPHIRTLRTFISANVIQNYEEEKDMETPAGIFDASPSVLKNGRLQKRARLRQGWLNATYSSGNTRSSKGISNGRYRQMMVDLAIGIEGNANQKKLDVVLLIDTTGSMMDNVRGIRGYTDAFMERLRWNKFDVALGVVTFSDGTEKPKAKGVTSDFGEFKNWLYHTEFTGGGDRAENGLDALITALNDIKYRRRTQKFFIMASDGPFHDADYNGRSEYSLDQVISRLKEKKVQVDVLGLDYLPMKQLAWATGGKWRLIPGKGYLENIQMPLPAKIYSQLGILSTNSESLVDVGKSTYTDDILVTFEDEQPEWVTLTWKVLNPHGEKYLSDFVDKKIVTHDTNKIRFSPKIDINGFSGTYTLIYKISDSLGNKSILRRTVDVK